MFFAQQTSQGLLDDLQRSSQEVDGITYTAILGALQQGAIAIKKINKANIYTYFEVEGRHNQEAQAFSSQIAKGMFKGFGTVLLQFSPWSSP